LNLCVFAVYFSSILLSGASSHVSLDFIKYRRDILVPIALLALSVGVLSYNSLSGGAGGLNPFSSLVLTLISYPKRLVSGSAEGIKYYWGHYADLRGAEKENDLFHRKVDELQMRIQQLNEENARLRAGMSTDIWKGAEFVTAQIIGLSPLEEYRVVTINAGSDAGIRYGMAVITGAGTVGKIIGSGGGHGVPSSNATVLLLVDPRCRVDALIYRYNPPSGAETQAAEQGLHDPACPWNPINWQQTRVRGVVEGAQDRLILKFVSRDADLRPGDRVVSSGLGGVFPRGLLIGIVSRVVQPEVGLSPYIEVTPAVNFDSLEEVQVMIQKGAPPP